MRRRDFIKVIGATAAGWPLSARAQQSATPVIGYLGSSSFERSAGRSLLNFKRGLADTGYVEERNVNFVYRWADDHYERLPALAVELVQLRVAVLVAAARRLPCPQRRLRRALQFQPSSWLLRIRSSLVSWQALIVRAAISPGSLILMLTLRQNAWRCCTSSFQQQSLSDFWSTRPIPLRQTRRQGNWSPRFAHWDCACIWCKREARSR